jgi:hypothetical protein
MLNMVVLNTAPKNLPFRRDSWSMAQANQTSRRAPKKFVSLG